MNQSVKTRVIRVIMFKVHPLQKPEQIVFEDRFRQVELAITFKKITCYHCGFQTIYKYRVQQVRRNPEIGLDEGEEIRADHRQIWRTVPRFAQIPETLKCRRCKEVLTLEVLCVY